MLFPIENIYDSNIASKFHLCRFTIKLYVRTNERESFVVMLNIENLKIVEHQALILEEKLDTFSYGDFFWGFFSVLACKLIVVFAICYLHINHAVPFKFL